mmetsp:Transcript_1950/g.6323  ORF Transcript_1950/g.6323 Transcript_1950/m.6323 type:complete len:86 (+) Transcript_1950:1645-1902(+)
MTLQQIDTRRISSHTEPTVREHLDDTYETSSVERLKLYHHIFIKKRILAYHSVQRELGSKLCCFRCASRAASNFGIMRSSHASSR